MARIRRKPRSISLPIILGAITVPLAAALLVGWLLLLVRQIRMSTEIAGSVWLLVLGAISFLVIMVVLVLFSVLLAREILEVRKQNTFIDSVTHELKTPLASLQLCLETLEREDVQPGQQKQLRQMMLDDVDRLSAFIDDVLHATRLSHAHPGTLNLSDVSLRELAVSCVRGAAARHRLDTSAFVIDVDPNLTLTTDRAVLEIVVKNLIDNAAKYSNEPAHITILGRANNGAAMLEVKDTGIGLEPKQLKRVFQRFYRVDDAAVRKRKGTGLGLFVVYALVRQMDGRVEAFSEGIGKGTTIRVTLPVARRENR